MKNVANFGSEVSAASIAGLVIDVIRQSSMAWLVVVRIGHPLETCLAEELSLREKPDHRFLAVLGQDRDLDLASVNEKDGVGDVALAEDLLVLLVSLDRPSRLRPAKKNLRIEVALGSPNLWRVEHGAGPSGGSATLSVIGIA